MLSLCPFDISAGVSALENRELFPVLVELRLAEVNKLNYWMARFITEVRRKDGNDYPPNTVTHITAGLQRHLREECGRPGINLLKKDDTTFDLFWKSLNARMKKLTNRGVGVKVKRADPVFKSDEEKLWSTGVLNMDSLTGLSNCVFFTFDFFFRVPGKRRAQELAGLSVWQFLITRTVRGVRNSPVVQVKMRKMA